MKLLCVLFGCVVFSIVGYNQAAKDTTPINKFQWIISHNSCRVGPLPKYVKKAQHWPFKVLDQWDYYHADLTTQLDSFQLKGLEIDIYHDPKGGRYYKRKTNFFFGGKKKSYVKELQEPGLKVHHMTGVDYRTHNYTFKSVLKEILEYSNNNPNHFPLFIMVELKEKAPGNVFPANLFGHKKALKFDKEALLGIDEEIKEVFKDDLDKVYIPDSLRLGDEYLKETILKDGWPTLNQMRGKILFIGHAKEKTKERYLDKESHRGKNAGWNYSPVPSLKNRMMFFYLDEEHPEAAIIQVDDPIVNQEKIKELVKKGFIVRTRSDTPVHEAKTGDYTKFNKAKTSGAQIISTDYYKPDYRAKTSKDWSDFTVIFKGDTTVRLNPITHD